jgi:hypothetical protein
MACVVVLSPFPFNEYGVRGKPEFPVMPQQLKPGQ